MAHRHWLSIYSMFLSFSLLPQIAHTQFSDPSFDEKIGVGKIADYQGHVVVKSAQGILRASSRLEHGTVNLKKNAFIPPPDQIELFEGDMIVTDQRSRVKIKLHGKNAESLILGEKSIFVVKKAPSGKVALESRSSIILELKKGSIRSNVPRKYNPDGGLNFEVHTPSIIAGVRGTQFSVTHFLESVTSTVLTIEGNVSVRSADSQADLSVKLDKKAESKHNVGKGQFLAFRRNSKQMIRGTTFPELQSTLDKNPDSLPEEHYPSRSPAENNFNARTSPPTQPELPDEYKDVARDLMLNGVLD